jgi:hypothetical protein
VTKKEIDEVRRELESWATAVDVLKGTGSLPKMLRGALRLVSYTEEMAKQQEELRKRIDSFFKYTFEEDVVTWNIGIPHETTIEFNIEGKVVVVDGPALPQWLIDDLEQNEAERRNECAQGDAWKGGFAENH